MIMSNDALVKQYRSKICKGVEVFFAGEMGDYPGDTGE